MPVFDMIKGASAPQDARLRDVPVSLIRPNPDQPRRSFDERSIAELAASIKQVGLIQPLVVRRSGGGYELIAGERRLRAVKSLGMTQVRCMIENGIADADLPVMAVVENLQREDLGFFEEAEHYAALIERFGLTQEELGRKIGKSQSYIANKLRLLKLPEELRGAIAEAGLTERHARAFIRLDSDALRREAIERAAAGRLSVKETERLVDRLSAKKGAAKRPRMIRLFRDYRIFINTVDAACGQLRESGLAVTSETRDVEFGIEIKITVSTRAQ